MQQSIGLNFWVLALTGAIGCFTLACQRKTTPEDPGIWKKIDLNFRRIDSDGLRGPSGSKVAVNYEFCLPANEKYWKRVHEIDKTAQRQSAPGRSACTKEQWLIIGSTHQPRYQRVLYELAALPYIERIRETFWE